MADKQQNSDLFKFLLGTDIPLKNAASGLIALMAVAVLYLLSRHSPWLAEMAKLGNVAMGAAFMVVLVAAFLFAWLALSCALTLVTHFMSPIRERKLTADRSKAIRGVFNTLTKWQRTFVLRFITENRMQIPEWEVGSYQAIWGPEMDVLVRKGIISSYGSGMYEIQRVYWDYLKQNWRPETGELA